MIIILIAVLAISVASYFVCDLYFKKNETVKQINLVARIIFSTTLILSNLFISCIILLVFNIDSFQSNTTDLYLWKIFLILLCFIFFYLLPFYFLLKIIDYKTNKGIIKIIYIYSLYLILSNIIYNFYKGIHEQKIFDINFYFNYIKILEFLSFLGNIIQAINCSYNHITNLSILLIYPILKKLHVIEKKDDSIKKKISDVNDEISLRESKLNEKNNNNNKIIMDEIESLKSVQLSYEYQLNTGTRKEQKSQVLQEVKFNEILSLIKIIQALYFLINNFLRFFIFDYTSYTRPIDINKASFIRVISGFLFLSFSDGFIKFSEQVYSIILVILLFNYNIDVSDSRIIGSISVIFSWMKNYIKKSNIFELEIILSCVFISSYYIVTGLFVVNSIIYFSFQDKLRRILFTDFDYEKMCWYYDCLYVLACSFFIVKEVIEYTSIINVKGNLKKIE